MTDPRFWPGFVEEQTERIPSGRIHAAKHLDLESFGLWLRGVAGESAANDRPVSDAAEILRVSEGVADRFPCTAEKGTNAVFLLRPDHQRRNSALFFGRHVPSRDTGMIE